MLAWLSYHQNNQIPLSELSSQSFLQSTVSSLLLLPYKTLSHYLFAAVRNGESEMVELCNDAEDDWLAALGAPFLAYPDHSDLPLDP